MNLFNIQLSNLFKSRQVIKIISGLNNSNIYEIIKIVKAAELSGASYIDIIANTQIIDIIKNITSLPVCVSSIDPLELYNCVIAGADLVEIGNFDSFRKQNIRFSSTEVVNLAKETRRLIKNRDICVTIPSHLSLSAQIMLAYELEQLGINIIQTEGLVSSYDILNRQQKADLLNHSSDCISYYANIASEALSATYAISSSVSIPVISASGLNYVSSSMALSYGAAGVGISSSIKNKKNIYDMTNYIKQIHCSICLQTELYSNQSFEKLIKNKINQKLLINIGNK